MAVPTRRAVESGEAQVLSVPLPPRRFRPIRQKATILSTKLVPRTPSSTWIERKHLIAKLEEGAAKRLTIISAPAGFGKSCLASQWIHLSNRKFAWLSLDERDNALDQFVRYLVAALHTRVSGLARDVEELLLGLRLPPPQYLADRLALCFEDSDTTLTLALDDYHKISNREAHAFVERLIENLPKALRIVVLTRNDPPWLNKRWLVAGWVSLLRTRDLSFSLQETQSFFSRQGARIEMDAVKDLHNRTEGWVAGLQLAQLAGLTGGADLDRRLPATGAAKRFFRDFMVEEVVSRQSPQVQRFLALSAQFDRFCAPLCDAVIESEKGENSSEEIIQYLQSANLFLVPLDTEGVWFRYHHLFAEVLRSLPRLNLPKETLGRALRRAGGWFEEHGPLSDALECYLKAGDIESAAVCLENNLQGIIESDLSRRTLQRFLDLFPPNVEKLHPILLIARAFCSMARMDSPKTGAYLDRAETLLRRKSVKIPADLVKVVQSDLALARSSACFWAGDPRRAAIFGLRALRGAPRNSFFTRTMATLMAAFGQYMCGGKKAALKLLAKEATKDCEEGGHRASRLLMAQMAIHLWSGDFASLEDVYLQMERIHDAGLMDSFFYGYGTYMRGRAALEKNDLVSAEDYFRKMEPIRYQAVPRCYHDAQFGLALIASSRGDFACARKHEAAARNWAMEVQDPILLLASNSFSARLNMLAGKVPAEIVGEFPGAQWIHPWLELPYLTKLECDVHKASSGLRSRILPAIERGLAQARKCHNIPQAIQILTVKAVALWRIGLRKEALQTLQEALRMGQPRGFVRSFVDRSPLIRDLLQALLAKKPEDDYVRKLVQLHESTKAATAGRAGRQSGSQPSAIGEVDVGPLSNREIDVLIMLADRLSNKEIAQRLFISAETAKKHAANIYQKLGVHGRRPAVIAGRKLGLLPQR